MAANFRSALNQGIQQYGLRPPEWTFTTPEPQRWQVTLRLDPYLPVTSCSCPGKAAAKEDACRQLLQAHSELSQPPRKKEGSIPWTCILDGCLELVQNVRRVFSEEDLRAISSPVGVDCEGVCTESERAQLAQISLFDGKQAWVLGRQAYVESRDILTRFFGDESTIKVFCDRDADRRMLSPLFDEIVNTKDVQLMQLEGWKPPAFGNRRSLVNIWEKCTGSLGLYFKDKTLTVSAWDSSQLSDEQLRYAIADVYATYRCYQILTPPTA
ncbi:hypothetical protein CYMTET_37392 [Cymbomonas tetramitiformis]|uniref:3'-5' exonuclease domain-containing protein n=1 Tax=Cymbomonas tetramitiformis TaxID=36881 RepID=A0AAE0CE47_9CHLO|nr:hypothetical protein CYMTET_37392 [Cymbomonas tetramitiformis]